MGRTVVAVVVAGVLAGSPAAAQQAQPSDFLTDEFRASGALELIRAHEAYARGYNGTGITIGIVDSGLDVNHPEFAGKISPVTRNFSQASSDPDDMSDVYPSGAINGHGTHVAGLAAAARDGIGMHGVAWGAQVAGLRTSLDRPGVSAAYAHAIDAGLSVLNSSFGMTLSPARYVLNEQGVYVENPHHRVMDRQFMELKDFTDWLLPLAGQLAGYDVVTIHSAGNNHGDQPRAARVPATFGLLPLVTPANTRSGQYYGFLHSGAGLDMNNPDTWTRYAPADLSAEIQALDLTSLRGAFITVVATDSDGAIAEYSNRCGAAADWCMAAPGGGDSGESGAYSTYPDSTYERLSGTSMAAPVVAGAAGVLKQAFPYLTGRQIMELLLTTANGSGRWADASLYGWGMLDLGRAVGGPVWFGARDFFDDVFRVDTQGHHATWYNDIRGAGGLSKQGDGTLRLAGHNTYTGPTDVSGGTLAVAGSIAASSVTVGAAGRLTGGGEVGATRSHGVVAPGDGVGTLTVQGDFTQYDGATLAVELDGQGGHDVLRVAGLVDWQGGRLEVAGALAPAQVGVDLPVVQASGGAVGIVGDVASPQPYLFLKLRGHAGAGGVALRTDRTAAAFADHARTRNQAAVARALDAHGRGAFVYAPIALTTAPQASSLPARFDALAGEPLASVATLARSTGLQMQAVVASRWQSDTSRRGAWAQALASQGRWSGGGEAHGWRRTLSGVALGAEQALGDNAFAGVSWLHAQSRVHGLPGARLRETSDTVALYGGWRDGAWQVAGGLTHGWHRQALRRDLARVGLGQAESDGRAQLTQVFLEGALHREAGRWRWTPYVALSHGWLRQSALSEHGSAAALGAAARRSSMTHGTVGVRLGPGWDTAQGGTVRLETGLGWRHAFGAVQPIRSLRFLDGGPAYVVAGTPMARNSLLMQAALSWEASARFRLVLRYHGEAGGGRREHGGQLGATWRF